jgi:hypothetical protein
MTEHERDKVKLLCARIVDEKNPLVFRQLVIELEALLERVTNHQDARLTEVEGEDTAN